MAVDEDEEEEIRQDMPGVAYPKPAARIMPGTGNTLRDTPDTSAAAPPPYDTANDSE
jgi:hypothetical protein